MGNVLDSFKLTRTATQAILNKWGYQINSSGTKVLALKQPLDVEIGYWESASNVSNKPPRWILHMKNVGGVLKTDLAKDAAGNLLPSAGMPGYLNNREGKCAVAMFRIMPAIHTAPTSNFSFPPDWEWILLVGFPAPLPAGTSGETLSNYNPIAGTFDYKGNLEDAGIPYTVGLLGIVTSSAQGTQVNVDINGVSFSYQQATDSIRDFLQQSNVSVVICDPTNQQQLDKLVIGVESVIAATQPQVAHSASQVTPATNLFGISESVYDLINASLAIGKRHFIFYGPPGTGKTTLAEHVASQLSEDGSSFLQLTASSSWSGQDLVGGYQPLGPGKIGFIPGAMLRDFDKPIIIDEMNRCPIDKVIGPLFSVLSGQASSLPYRVNVEDANSEFFKVLPAPTASKLPSEFAPGPAWSMICTLNQVDKTQLGQVSYALSRRFAWIRIGVPEDLKSFILDILEQQGLLKSTKDVNLPSPAADMWASVNVVREIGGAPIIDFIKLISNLAPSVDLLSSPAGNPKLQNVMILALGASVLPLLDGIRRVDAENLHSKLTAAWHLEQGQQNQLRVCLMELAL